MSVIDVRSVSDIVVLVTMAAGRLATGAFVKRSS